MTVQTKEQIFTLLHDHQSELRRLGVQRYGVFGSFIRNAVTDQSDVDLLVEFAPGQKTFDHFMPVSYTHLDVYKRQRP